MNLELLKRVIACGDQYGSGIRQMLSDLKICDLQNVTDEQIEWWLREKGEKNGELGNDSKNQGV
jgi:hypothetical protein